MCKFGCVLGLGFVAGRESCMVLTSLVGPGSVCVGCLLRCDCGGSHYLTTLVLITSITMYCTITYCRVWFMQFCLDCADGQVISVGCQCVLAYLGR